MADRMAAIWKFTLQPDVSKVDMPGGAQPLHVGCQGEVFMLWAQVDPTAPVDPRWFNVVGTGHPFDPDTVKAYVGTIHYPYGGLIFHVLEVTGD